MKLKSLLSVSLAALLCAGLCSCGGPAAAPGSAASSPEPAVSSPPEPAASAPAEAPALPAELPAAFTFASGVGGWSTELELAPDGSFTGLFHDSDMGDSSKAYPYGTVYYCSFRGQFGDIVRVDEHTYTMTLLSLTQEQPEGVVRIEITDGIRYVSSSPYGLSEAGSTYRLYLPDTPLAGLSEEFLSWWPLRYEQDAKKYTQLSCWGLLNEKEEYGFFSCDEHAFDEG